MDSKIIVVYGIDHSVREVIPEICPGVVFYEDRRDYRSTRMMMEAVCTIKQELDCHVIIAFIDNSLLSWQPSRAVYGSADVVVQQASEHKFKVLKNRCGPLSEEYLGDMQVHTLLSEILNAPEWAIRRGK